MLTADKIIKQSISPYDKKTWNTKNLPTTTSNQAHNNTLPSDMIVGTQKKVSPRVDIIIANNNNNTARNNSILHHHHHRQEQEYLLENTTHKLLPDLTAKQTYHHLVQASMLDQTLDK